MEPTIHLIAGDERFSAHLPLQAMRTDYTEVDGCVIDIVYQWALYEEYRVEGVIDNIIAKVELLVNDNPTWIERWYVANDCLYIRPSVQDVRPFANIFGFTSVTLRLTMRSGHQVSWYTGILAVAVESDKEEYTASLQEMLRFIYKRDRSLLIRSRRSVRHQDNSENFAPLMRDIAEQLYSALPLFSSCPRTSIATSTAIEPLEKLRTVTGSTLQFVAAHPEYLTYSCGTMGITVGRHQMLPERVPAGGGGTTFDTYENRTIVSFINYLLQRLQERREELKSQNERDELTLTVRGSLLSGYVLSINILGQFLSTVIRERLRDTEELELSFSELLVQYTRTLRCEPSPLEALPQPTAVFMQVPHYRGVFEAMCRWFADGEQLENTEGNAVHFASADVIYELYCLQMIQGLLEKEGFVEDLKRRNTFKYMYRPPKFNTYDGDNTFYYRNENTGCELTLYYQPLIYGDIEDSLRNGIDLVRVDCGENNSKYFYSPDFLFKRSDAQGTAYGIIDAKWRNREAIMKSALSDAVNKYLHSVVERNTWKSVPFMWLVQGKDDDSGAAYRRFTNPIFRKNSAPSWLTDSLGVLRLTPASGGEELEAVLSAFLQPGAFIA